MRSKKSVFIAVIILFACIFPASCAYKDDSAQYPLNASGLGSERLTAAIVHAGEGGGYWRDTMSRMEQSITLGLDIVETDVNVSLDFSGAGVIYLDESVMTASGADDTREAIVSFVREGGYVFLTNGFYDFFEKDFIGAERFEKINDCPVRPQCPEVSSDLTELQEVVADFAGLYAEFADYAEISAYDYGYGVVPSTACTLIECDDLALYTINDYGSGKVFFTNPLLPNAFAVTGFSVVSRDERQKSLSDTTASFNRLLEGRFAAYKMRNENGYSAERVFGSNGSPGMSWELHFEEVTGIINNSAEIFGELCREYWQIPSYTLIRNTYWWFMRAESITYLLGDDVGFLADEYENAYSSGTHIAAGDKWLSLTRVENAGSYFTDYPQYKQRAYPALDDMDGDGLIDIISGSADGYFYFYKGEGFSDRLHTAPGIPLTDRNGDAIRLNSYSAPVIADVNADGFPDIVSGSADGKLYWFSGGQGLSFEYEGLLCQLKLTGLTMPEITDFDGDGRLDVIVGTSAGEIAVCYGETERGVTPGRIEKYTLPTGLGHWIAPCAAGKGRLYVGLFEGYIAELILEDTGFWLDGYLTGEEMNFRGNYNLRFGNNCVPRFADLNNDGKTDLIAGALEYGLAYPIDSPYFPYRAELEAVVDYMRENDYYVGPHFYTKKYASAERERNELMLHSEAMLAYGLSFDAAGTNHHTWHSSSFAPARSLKSEWEAGLLWNSGFAPGGGSEAAPELSAKNAVVLPFFLMQGEKRTLLVANCSTVLYAKDDWTALSAKYNMPISIYYHCDLAYQNIDGMRSNVEKVEAFRRNNGYNFVSEDQMMLASAAAINLNVDFSADENGFSLEPDIISEDFPLFDVRYQNSCGVKLSFRSDIDVSGICTDASVWRIDGRNMYISLDKKVNIYCSSDSRSRIERVNLPADITFSETGTLITFSDGGLMEVAVRGEVRTESQGWTVKRDGELTVFMKFGEPETLNILY